MPRWRAAEPRQQRARELRRNETASEAKLWEALRNRRLGGLKFRRQVTLGRFIADFYCAERRLVIEVDGPVHEQEGQAAYDQARTEALESCGYRVVRFTNAQIEEDIVAVLQDIYAAITTR